MNIYISNLSYDVNDGDLKDLFAEYGEVTSAKVITDKMSGQSRGFGFVEMENVAQAQKAIDELNKCEYEGKILVVNPAKPKTDRTDSRGNGGYNSNRRNSRY
jgi:RNA recognition motif-containing protein